MKGKQLIDPYESCLCGSGKKYKFCCYGKSDKEFHNSNELYIFTEKNKRKISFCLHEDCNCLGDIIKSHSIQNNKILSKLSVKGHVYCAGYNANNLAGIDLKKCGRYEASTSNCFCLHHDTELFKPIEREDYIGTEEQSFLYAYRAFSKAYYDKLSEQATQQCLFANVHNRFLKSKVMIDQIRGINRDIEHNEELRKNFNAALDNGDFSVVETVTATLDYEIKFATSYVYPMTYDLMGKQINDVWSQEDVMKNIYVNVFPESGKTHILISWLREDSDAFAELKSQFIILQKNHKLFINTINNMIICQTDNFAISPEMVESWDDKTRKSFLSEFVSFIFGTKECENIGMEIEKNLVAFPCKFDLFG